MCHPEAQPKDLDNEKEILRFAQNDSFAGNDTILRSVGKPRVKRGAKYSLLWEKK